MANNQDNNSVLVSAARVVGSALGRVKNLTSTGTDGELESQPPQKAKTKAAGTTPRPPRSRASAAARVGRQVGASRSPRQTESKSRSKSRSKSSKSRKSSTAKKARRS